jgi:hypothetical protein
MLGRRRDVIAVATAAFVVLAWLVFSAGGGDRSSGVVASRPMSEPVVTPFDGLRAVATAAGHPILWAGRLPHRRLQIVQRSDGVTYVRYLPPGAQFTDQRPRYLTVGTFASAGAFTIVQGLARRAGARVHRLAGGGIAVTGSSAAPGTVFAYPGVPIEGLVFAPTRGRALKLLETGRIRQVASEPAP